jgi:hypothetical protein
MGWRAVVIGAGFMLVAATTSVARAAAAPAPPAGVAPSAGAPGASPAAAATSPATTQATDTPADPSTPKGALKALAKALDAGDRAAVLELLAANSEQERRVAAATADLAEATVGLRRVATRAFGEKASRPLGVDPGATPEALARIDAATVDLKGDRATLRTPQQEGPPIVLARQGNTWRVPVSELSKDVEAADVERNLKDVAEQTRLMRELTAEVAAGKYKTAADARQALDQRILHSAMPQLEPGAGAATAAAKNAAATKP